MISKLRPLMSSFVVTLWKSSLGLIGAVLTTVSALLFVILFLIQQLGFEGGAYLGIVSFLLLPTVFVLGLLLVPLGMWRLRVRERHLAATGAPPLRAPVIDFNVPRTQGLAALALGFTLVNLVILGTGTYKGVEFMESTQFCGGSCHSVMSPELTAYQRSPHSRVACTECHVGSGAGWFLKSKLSGTRQLAALAFNSYKRPIPTPVHNLRPASQTCEHCHSPTRFVGEKLRIYPLFALDEKQTPKKTVVLLNVGGTQQGKANGIHWHADPRHSIRFRSDPSRRTIYDVELTSEDGKVQVFQPSAAATRGAVPSDWQSMDCATCHNRLGHEYRLAKDEVDAALDSKQLDPTLPFIKREGLKALEPAYASQDAAREGIRKALFDFYGKEYAALASAEPKRIDGAATVLGDLYARNVFPQMKIGWGNYPSFSGHTGCFRCHDDAHAAPGGETISKGCDFCHTTIATEEADPEILQVLHP